MLVTVAKRIKKIKSHPGHIIVIGDKGDIYIINIYTMTLIKHFLFEFEGCVDCIYKNNVFILCGKYTQNCKKLFIDNFGKVFLWKDESQPSPIKNVA